MVNTFLGDSTDLMQGANSKHLKEPLQKEDQHDRHRGLCTGPIHKAIEYNLEDNLDSLTAGAE